MVSFYQLNYGQKYTFFLTLIVRWEIFVLMIAKTSTLIRINSNAKTSALAFTQQKKQSFKELLSLNKNRC
ncbi:MAG: hypothetical protein CSA38_03295 [Flavobacteriales bacterium]|nr:MAG: hypothetical protein CSA38_03295 [Flavobacteriales bacterium]